ncbi:hypothetical protein PPERSA_04113 [Pseudocohnilembus persalinus]|uniref:Transmembrane protein n=1 Tax=Pseudocohnilembus persalinus TaxID=266149 RepID=A0A0V0QMG8_PSEPJ|nr:hypothetical protein PPERSA_04113 [Pseudocohnilembus persalinus]|eukprot:KRX03561.1 hypothetical protein PPERSA_04113 [Pseudocohnilembus persalinus]
MSQFLITNDNFNLQVHNYSLGFLLIIIKVVIELIKKGSLLDQLIALQILTIIFLGTGHYHIRKYIFLAPNFERKIQNQIFFQKFNSFSQIDNYRNSILSQHSQARHATSSNLMRTDSQAVFESDDSLLQDPEQKKLYNKNRQSYLNQNLIQRGSNNLQGRNESSSFSNSKEDSWPMDQEIKMEVNKVIEGEKEEEIIQDLKKRKFFINKYQPEKQVEQKDLRYMKLQKRISGINIIDQKADFQNQEKLPESKKKGFQMKIPQIKFPGLNIKKKGEDEDQNKQQNQEDDMVSNNQRNSVNSSNTTTKNILDFIGDDLNKSNNNKTKESPDRKFMEKYNNEDLIKIEKKKFFEKIEVLEQFIKSMMNIEDNYYKQLSEVGKPQFLRPTYQETLYKLEKKFYQKKLHKFNIQELREDKQPIVQEFLFPQFKNQAETGILMPGWNIFKAAIVANGKTHQTCAMYLQKGAIDFCQMLKQEYQEDYQKIKEQKKNSSVNLQKDTENLIKIQHQFENTQKQLQAKTEQFKDPNKKEQAIQYVELQNQINTLRNQLFAAKNRRREAKKIIQETNKEIYNFKRKWQKQLQNLIKTVMRGILQSYNEMCQDQEKIFSELLNYSFIVEEKELFNNLQNSKNPTTQRLLPSQNNTVNNQSSLNNHGTDNNSMNFQDDNFFDLQEFQDDQDINFTVNQSFSQNSTQYFQKKLEIYQEKFDKQKKIQEKYQNELAQFLKYDTEVSNILEDVEKSTQVYSENLGIKILHSKTLKGSKQWSKKFLQQLGQAVHEGIGDNKEIMRNFYLIIGKQNEEVKSLKQEIETKKQSTQEEYRKFSKQLIILQQQLQKDLKDKSQVADNDKKKNQQNLKQQQRIIQQLSEIQKKQEDLFIFHEETIKLIKKNVLIEILLCVDKQIKVNQKEILFFYEIKGIQQFFEF